MDNISFSVQAFQICLAMLNLLISIIIVRALTLMQTSLVIDYVCFFCFDIYYSWT